MGWKGLLSKVGNVAEVAGELTGVKALELGGELIGEIVDDETDTAEFIKDLDIKQLLNLSNAINKTIEDKLK